MDRKPAKNNPNLMKIKSVSHECLSRSTYRSKQGRIDYIRISVAFKEMTSITC